ncbi:MAG: mechanosensitive ion channel family protein [Zoogloeaceae bacterium]|nr:mechanosensitive ion channel family protein [Zoogloeaceae bacterium]
MKSYLPEAFHPWIESITLGLQVVLIMLGAWVLNMLVRRLTRRVGQRYNLPPELLIGARRTFGFVIYSFALLLVLDRFGVSGTVLWTAFTGFAAVAAVAFFAAWSVLSNIFCTMLILTTRPFRLYDHIEVLENGEKPGLKGLVVDINLIHTTLQEKLPDGSDTVLQIPNSLFFQRAVRRWRSEPPQAAVSEDESRL